MTTKYNPARTWTAENSVGIGGSYLCVYGMEGPVPDPADGDFVIPLGVADLKRTGSDVSLIAHGRSVLQALAAAEILDRDHGIQADVLDLRSIRPLDEAAILATVCKTHRVVIIDESGVVSRSSGNKNTVAHRILDAVADFRAKEKPIS